VETRITAGWALCTARSTSWSSSSRTAEARHINNIELGRHGRNRTNVWDYAGVNSFGQDRPRRAVDAPDGQTVAMVADALLDCSLRDGIVLDCFGGSGNHARRRRKDWPPRPA